MYSARRVTLVAALTGGIGGWFSGGVARAEDSATQPAPATPTVATSEVAAETEAPSPEAPGPAPAAEALPTPDALPMPDALSTPAPDATPGQPEPAKPNAIKWRPLVLRSEIPPDQRPMFGSFKGTYLMIGPNVGLGLSFSSLLLGGEVSVVHQTTEFGWFGAYVDGVHDFGREQTRFSIGPEVGWSALGLDAGYLLMTTPSGVSNGVTVRPLVSLGYVTLFGRFSKELTASARVWTELGLLLKYPIEL